MPRPGCQLYGKHLVGLPRPGEARDLHPAEVLEHGLAVVRRLLAHVSVQADPSRLAQHHAAVGRDGLNGAEHLEEARPDADAHDALRAAQGAPHDPLVALGEAGPAQPSVPPRGVHGEPQRGAIPQWSAVRRGRRGTPLPGLGLPRGVRELDGAGEVEPQRVLGVLERQEPGLLCRNLVPEVPRQREHLPHVDARAAGLREAEGRPLAADGVVAEEAARVRELQRLQAILHLDAPPPELALHVGHHVTDVGPVALRDPRPVSRLLEALQPVHVNPHQGELAAAAVRAAARPLASIALPVTHHWDPLAGAGARLFHLLGRADRREFAQVHAAHGRGHLVQVHGGFARSRPEEAVDSEVSEDGVLRRRQVVEEQALRVSGQDDLPAMAHVADSAGKLVARPRHRVGVRAPLVQLVAGRWHPVDPTPHAQPLEGLPVGGCGPAAF